MKQLIACLMLSIMTTASAEIKIPARSTTPTTGSEFVKEVKDMHLNERESRIYREVAKGNVPEFLRKSVIIRDTLTDAKGNGHQVEIRVLPDFIAIGTNSDFLRIPTVPGTAQKIADLYGASLPTRKISDLIHKYSIIKMNPMNMTPDATMITIPVFAAQNERIEKGRKIYNLPLNTLIAGHKKDIVIANRMKNEPGRLFIYGWHYPNGKAIQPLSAAHNDGYVDYSHGIRLIDREVLVDGMIYDIKDLLKHPVLYKLLSDEECPMQKTEYDIPEYIKDIPVK